MKLVNNNNNPIHSPTTNWIKGWDIRKLYLYSEKIKRLSFIYFRVVNESSLIKPEKKERKKKLIKSTTGQSL